MPELYCPECNHVHEARDGRCGAACSERGERYVCVCNRRPMDRALEAAALLDELCPWGPAPEAWEVEAHAKAYPPGAWAARFEDEETPVVTRFKEAHGRVWQWLSYSWCGVDAGDRYRPVNINGTPVPRPRKG